MSNQSDAKLIIPALSPLYNVLAPLSDPLFRLALGGTVFIHGLGKLMTGPGPVVASMAKQGFQPAGPIAYWIIFLETVGALAIIFGVFTRFFAVCLAIESAVIAFGVQYPHGFSAPRGGYEMTLMWSALFLALAFRGAGNYSVDKQIGWQL